MNDSPPTAHKNWANHLRNLVGGECFIYNYYDDQKEYSIPIFSSTDSDGILVATVGLMEIDQSKNSRVQVPTEIIMDRKGKDERIANVLSTIAFYIMKDGWKVAPGVIFEDIMKMYYPETKLPHIYFTAPFQWDTMSKVELTGKTIYPLVAIPVTEDEANIVSKHGDQDLEDMWVRHEVNVLNWDRENDA